MVSCRFMSSTETVFLGESPITVAPHLPLSHSPSQEDRIRRDYEALLEKVTSGSDIGMAAAHRDVLETNLTNRFGHVARQPQTIKLREEVIQFSWVDRGDISARMATFATFSAMNSLELMSIVEARDKPAYIDGRLGDTAVSEYVLRRPAVVDHHDYQLRPKVKRLIDIDEDRKAAVVTAKTGGRTVIPEEGSAFEVKTRHSGFVVLDETLDREQLQAFKILGQMSWGEKITEHMVADFREVVTQSVTEEQLFYPTLCTLYIARHIADTQSQD